VYKFANAKWYTQTMGYGASNSNQGLDSQGLECSKGIVHFEINF